MLNNAAAAQTWKGEFEAQVSNTLLYIAVSWLLAEQGLREPQHSDVTIPCGAAP